MAWKERFFFDNTSRKQYVLHGVYKNQVELLKELSNQITYVSKGKSDIISKLEKYEETEKVQSSRLKVINKKIEKLTSDKYDSHCRLIDLSCKSEALKFKMIENAILIDVIVVEDNKKNYNLANGLVDLNRDVLMRILKIMVRNPEIIRNIIGMTQIFYNWSKYRIFHWARSDDNDGFGTNGFTLLKDLDLHAEAVNTMIISPDSTLMATASRSSHGKIQLYDATTPKLSLICTLLAKGVVRNLVFSPNRFWLAAASDAGVEIFSLDQKIVVATITSADFGLAPKSLTVPPQKRLVCLSVAFSADGNRLFAGWSDGGVRVWEIPVINVEPSEEMKEERGEEMFD